MRTLIPERTGESNENNHCKRDGQCLRQTGLYHLSLNIEALSETYDRAMSEAAERIEGLQGATVRVGYHKET